MMPTRFNKFEKVNINVILLIHGYVPFTDIKNHIIPTSIINLLINFYHHYVSKLVAIEEDSNCEEEPQIICR